MTYLICYAIVIGFLVWLREYKQKSTLDSFLLADRKVGGAFGSMSIAASWIWAPAIFISSQTGYRWGLSGLLWFIVPNMLALVIFAPFASKVRSTLPLGYSYIEYLRKGHPSFLWTQLSLQLIMQIVIFAIQLVAGAELLAELTGASYAWMVIGMALTPLSYTFFSGLRTSIFTDALQYMVIAVSAVSLLFFFPFNVSRIDLRTFHPLDPTLLYEFGISSALGLLVAIFADHQQWQRAFAIQEGQLSKTFYKAATMHGLVTTSLGLLGCLIFTHGFSPQRIDLVGVEFVSIYYPPFFVSLFVIMSMCALISTLDSALCAFSSLAMKECSDRPASLSQGRIYMAILTTSGIAVALGRPTLITLWFVASTIRLSSFLPTVVSIVGKNRPTKAYTVAIVSSLVCGGSIFATGVLLKDNPLRTVGMILTFAISGGIIGLSKLFGHLRSSKSIL